jgi:hypothetical protein
MFCFSFAQSRPGLESTGLILDFLLLIDMFSLPEN